MAHKRAESANLTTPTKRTTATSRPKSMFARLSPKSADLVSSNAPDIPSKSPRRRMKQRFSLMLRPTAAAHDPTSPSAPSHDISPLRTPVRSLSLKRAGSLQTRRYNYEGKNEEWPPSSPRRSIYSQATPSRSSLHLAKAAQGQGTLSPGPAMFADPPAISSPSLNSPQHTPSLMQSPQLEVQNSVWIKEDKPHVALEKQKRSSFLGRSSSVRAPRTDPVARQLKTLSTGGASANGLKIGSPLISSPQLMETTQALDAADPIKHAPSTPRRSNTTKKTPKLVNEPVSLARGAPESPKSPSQSPGKKGLNMLKRLFKREKNTKAEPATQFANSIQSPTRSVSNNAIPSSISATVAATKEDRRRKYKSATAVSKPTLVSAPSRPSRQPGLDLFRQSSQLSLQSSHESHNSTGTHSADMVTPITAKTSSPRIFIEQEWDYSTIYHRNSGLMEDKQYQYQQSPIQPPKRPEVPEWI